MELKKITEKESYLRVELCRGCWGKSTHFIQFGSNITIPTCSNDKCIEMAKIRALEIAQYFKKHQAAWHKKYINKIVQSINRLKGVF